MGSTGIEAAEFEIKRLQDANNKAYGRIANLEETCHAQSKGIGRLSNENVLLRARVEKLDALVKSLENGWRCRNEGMLSKIEDLCEERDGLRAKVEELEALHRTYYNQPFAEACQRAAHDERERCISEAFGWWAGTENLETITTDEAAEGIRAALTPKPLASSPS